MAWRILLAAAFEAIFATATVASAYCEAIENEFFSLQWSAESQSLQILDNEAAQEVVHNLEIIGVGKDARIESIVDEEFGSGQQFVFDQTKEATTRVQVFPNLQFALVKVSLHNRTPRKIAINRLKVASAAIGWRPSAGNLTTFGTGGLNAVYENPGSYAWLALVEPRCRQGVVIGWLTHDRASGVLFSREDEGRPSIDARLDYGRLTISPDETTELETLAIGFFDDARFGLEAWADAVAKVYKIQLPPQPTGYCTWYSQPHGGASDETHLVELAEFAAEKLAPYGLSFIQIDDKWQAGESTNGPKRNFSTHDPDGPYPSGMEETARKVSQLGLTPGLWFMPFAGTYYDPYYADKQDWFVKRQDGSPFETRWGGTCLDMTHPEARKHLRSLVDRISKDWGFSYFKIDGLWTGTASQLTYVNSGYEEDGFGESVFYDPAKTNIEAYREGLQIVRETAGPDVFILGCNGPQNMRSYGGAIGFVDAMRVGPDNGPQWDKLTRGPAFGSRHYFMHRRVWYNDPDPVYVRESIPLNQAKLICSWVAISGQLNVSSDWLPGLPAERLDILKRCMPSHSLTARPVDLFESDLPKVWELADPKQPSRRLIALFNWEDNPGKLGCSFGRLELDEAKRYAAFDYWNDELITPISNDLDLDVPGRSCRILSLCPLSDRPQLISTSRHVTQGVVDVLDCRWDETTFDLKGQSLCVANDRYELRVLLPQDSWQLGEFRARQGDIPISRESVTQEGQLLRIAFIPEFNGAVNWSIRLRPGSE